MTRGARHWHTTKGGSVGSLPQGIIIGLASGESMPEGWDAVGATNFIKGTTGVAKQTGGSTRVGSAGSGGGGNHAGGGDTRFHRTRSSGNVALHNGINTRGNHSHTVYVDYTPAQQRINLIKANGENPIPVGGLTFGQKDSPDEGQSPYSTLNDKGGYLVGSTVTDTVGQSVGGSTSKSSFSHHHHDTADADALGGAWAPDSQTDPSSGPSHGHSISVSLSDKIAAYVLCCYVNSEEAAPNEGTIALWDQDGLPDGWILCDGGNGTPDLNGKFIRLQASGFGAIGSGKVDASGSLKSGGSHNHNTGKSGSEWMSGHSHINNESHTHSYSMSKGFEPQFTTYKFIQRTD